MAKAVRTTIEIMEPVLEDVVVLTLTLEEARVLKNVVGKIHGPVEGHRGKASNIYYALEELDIKSDYSGRGSISFS